MEYFFYSCQCITGVVVDSLIWIVVGFNGRIRRSGGKELARELEENCYADFGEAAE